MPSISAFNSATLGIQTHLQQLNDAAAHIASRPLDPDAIVDLLSARHGIVANAAVIRTADEVLGTLVDILA